MNWLRKAKNSAILVDVILVIILFLAAIGFASFVHLRNSDKPVAIAAVSELDIHPESQSLLGASTDESTTDIPPSSDKGSDGAIDDHAEDRRVKAHGPPIAVVLPAVPLPCDAVKKLQLKATYDNNVYKENKIYEEAIKSLRIFNPALGGGDAQNILKPEHIAKLTSIWNDYLKQLAAINCAL